jgi:hypothetical protein
MSRNFLAYPIEGEGRLFPVSVSGEGEDAADEAVRHEADGNEGRKDEPEDDFYSGKGNMFSPVGLSGVPQWSDYQNKVKQLKIRK